MLAAPDELLAHARFEQATDRELGRRPVKAAAAVLLILEAIVVLLAGLAAVGTTDVANWQVWTGAAALAVLCVLAAGTLRRGTTGLVLGSAVQLLALASGFVVTTMFILGVLFGALWVMALVLDRRVEAVRAAREA